MKIGAVGFYNQNRKQSNNSKIKAEQTATSTLPLNKQTAGNFSHYALSFKGSIKLPFMNMRDIPCPWCGRIMIPQKDVASVLESWPQTNEPFSAKYVLKDLSQSIRSMSPYEKKIFGALQKLNKGRPNAKFVDLLKGFENPPKSFKEYAKAKIKLSPEAHNAKVISLLQPFENRMHPIEKEVFLRIKNLHARLPKKSLQELMLIMRPENIKILEEKQLKTLNEIDLISNDLSPTSAEKVKNLIEETKNVIVDESAEDPFKRKIFLKKIFDITKTFPETDYASKIIEKAWSIPTSQSDASAFIVKYSGKTIKNQRRSSKEIATRLLSPSEGSIDHLVAQKSAEGLRGENSRANAAMMDKDCNNNDKSNIPLYECVKLNPSLPKNFQKYISVIIDKINNGTIKNQNIEKYPEELKQTLAKASKGTIMLDISKLDTSRLKKSQNFDIEVLGEKFNLKTA